MIRDQRYEWNQFLRALPPALSPESVRDEWQAALSKLPPKIIVLDDDPTGTQTVYDVPVYTAWDKETLCAALLDESRVVYILTNSRALNRAQTTQLHSDLARDLKQASQETRVEFLLISRGDSTLRGHYPLETETLRRGLGHFDGEIIIPFFEEGGRFTAGGVHFVREGDNLIPAGQTEFARDSTFGYQNSYLRCWIDEKSKGEYSKDSVTGIWLEHLRQRDYATIVDKLKKVENFNKVVVNAVDYSDLQVFTIALAEAIAQGKRFLFRTAASFVRVAGGLERKPLLTREALRLPQNQAPGVVVVGSYIEKTTRQLQKLRELPNLSWIEWDVSQAESVGQWQKEVQRVTALMENALSQGQDVCLYTGRTYYRKSFWSSSGEEQLAFGARVSDGLVEAVKSLQAVPGFLVAKGGITSSDVALKALGVKRAMVMGQIAPGVPVWRLGEETRCAGLPYVIFPGNVGNEDTLREVVKILRG